MADEREAARGEEIIEKIIDDCLECGLCMSECEFLKKYGPPKVLAGKLKGGLAQRNLLVYSCNICGLCGTLCPIGIDFGELFILLRRTSVKAGLPLLPGHEVVKKTQEYIFSDAFYFVHSGTKSGKCERIFFPGCNLSGYSPEIVVRTYGYLMDNLDNTGIILGCCGSPEHLLGDESSLKQILATLEKEVNNLGATQIITACPECYRSMKQTLPGINITSIYELLSEHGTIGKQGGEPGIVSVHDSCTARSYRSLQDSVRSILRKMGYEIKEVEYSRDRTRCCGAGGLVPFADLGLASDIIKRRASEFDSDIVTYCAGCREALAMEKPAIHVLDIFFNPGWKDMNSVPPKTGRKRRENQARTKKLLIEFLKDKGRMKDGNQNT